MRVVADIVAILLTVILMAGPAYGQPRPQEPPVWDKDDAPVVVPQSPQEKKALEELARKKEEEGKYDEVHLDDTTIIRGRVVDPGGPTLRVEQELGTVTILKRDIKPGGLRLASNPVTRDLSEDIVFLRDGKEIRGQARLSGDGKRLIVAIQRSGKRQEVGFPYSDVARIDWAAQRKKALKRQLAGYEDSLAGEVRRMIEKLSSADEVVWKAAREEIIKLGVFAVDYLKEELEALKGPAREKVKEILRVNEIKSYIPQGVVETLNRPGKKDIYDRLVCGDREEKLTILRQAVLLEGEGAAPLLVYMAKRAHEDKGVRNFCLHSLARAQRNDDLVELMTHEEGWLRLAAALHLADNGIYAGAPHFISALHMSDPGVRRVAISKLRLASGKNFGFDPHGTQKERLAAIRKWEAWWKENEAGILKDSAKNLDSSKIGERDRSFSRVYQKRGEDAWDKGSYKEAAKNFRQAIELDPSNLPARLSLAILLYGEMGRTRDARTQLQVILRRYSDETVSIMRKQALYHTALVDLSEGNWEGALHNLQAAIALDEEYSDAYIALGRCYYVKATRDKSMSPETIVSLVGDKRREREQRRAQVIARSVRALQIGLGLLDEEMRQQSSVDFRKRRREEERRERERTGRKPDEFAQAQWEESYRKASRRKKARVCVMLAESYALQRDFRKASGAMGDAVKLVPENAEYLCKQGFALAAAGKRGTAREAFKRCLAIDPNNEKAAKGLANLK